ncbi:MAG: ABC transporter permease subunit [Thermaerobacter sp.]|nr:ABC transporter permease subunit [Thermaerobacter sp.]
MAVVVRGTLVEILRKRLVLVAALVALLFFVLYEWGISELARAPGTAGLPPEAVAVSVLYVGMFFSYLMTALFSVFSMAGAIRGEIDDGTLLAVLPRPVSRWQILSGKWIGFGIVGSAYATCLAGGLIFLVHVTFGYPGASLGLVAAWLAFMGLVWIIGAVTLLGSVGLSPLSNGVAVMGLFFVALLGGSLMQILPGRALPQAVTVFGTITRLVFPVDGLYRWALYMAASRAVTQVPPAFLGPFGPWPVPSLAFLIYAAVYTAGVLVLASYLLHRRDV